MLMNKRFIVQLDKRQDPQYQNSVRRQSSTREEGYQPRYRPKEEPAVQQSDELLRLFKELPLPQEHTLLIKKLRAKQ